MAVRYLRAMPYVFLKKSSYGGTLPTSYAIRVLKEERFLWQYATRMPHVFSDRGSSYGYATPYFIIYWKRSRKNTATVSSRYYL